ncbi:MAG TPA: NifU family protein [Chitinophagales bacterium]|jgi:Fe-S cluster biogenesis protein NfuA|nr:NifU family protein [Chitinophagales bacterium]HPA35114.1 NifU family protein [Chitinophagales bacterium]HPW87148.1 NifU family protein [Chitinophagales bacterium]HQD11773.1 NifU family protein [Chitinophagales bacterium]HQO31637.1 NifU family protein [Chitinophagales bacterium]
MANTDVQKQELLEKVENALNNIRPFLQSDGGNIELIEITDDLIAKVKLLGNCDGCKMSASTMKAGVESTIKNFVPEIISVEAVN